MVQLINTLVIWISDWDYSTMVKLKTFMSLLFQCSTDIQGTTCSNCFNGSLMFWIHCGKIKVLGVTTDGAGNMTGCHRGALTQIQNAILPDGFYCIWCALHQLEIVIQKCVLHYFSDDFYSNLTGLIGYLRRQQNLI